MSYEVGPAVRRRQLARQLRELRTAAGFTTMEAAAAATGLSRATISRIESAKQVILPRTVRLLCQIYGIGSPTLDHLLRLAEQSDDRAWQTEFADTVPTWFDRYVGEESDATEMWTYEAEFVPGLLQTDDYCRAVRHAAEPDVTDDDADRSVAFRAARQHRLTAKRPPKLHAIINEAVLYRQVGGAPVMEHQLRHLVDLAGRPNITLQVLPFSAGAHPAMIGSFMMLHFPPSTGVATIFVEIDSGALYRDRPSDFERYTWVFRKLRDLALSPDQTIELIGRATAGALHPAE
ncbi:MAG TPA: Scr1 family TA system antitoxin-like transcriptional regulator [Pseudonocardiaceae bacterium]|jgi:transcriptional regulator with XRE-family HTH domain|nr:Scr1 family TA system antitoxin-like transcriptional regulator [Pseudonocardiaceae bacterium]